VLANDVVGHVISLGESVIKYAVGDRIVSHATFSPGSLQNGLQQYALADVDFSAKIPDSISDDEAATLPTNIIAPLVAIFDPGTLNIPAPWTSAAATFDYNGTTLLIIGGGSNCGRFGVQLAALAKIGKIVVVGGDETELKSYGATHVVSRFGGDDAVLSSIRGIVGDDLVYAFDAVNPASGQHLAVNALSNTKQGSLARLIPRDLPSEEKLHPKQSGYEIKNVFGSSQARPDLSKPFWEQVPGYLRDGKIKPLNFEVVENGLDAKKVNEVLDRYRDGKKVVQTHFHIR
jgi:NADPH:quinone reductase-like Zn-dependent oxidoreductase